jgi:hypothetical protein
MLSLTSGTFNRSPAISLNAIDNVLATGATAFSYIAMPGGTRTMLDFITSFGVIGTSSNTGTGSWLDSFSGSSGYSYEASPIAANNYFTQYGRVRVIDGDAQADGSDWAVFNFGVANGGSDFDGTANSNKYFGGESSYSGGSGGLASTGYIWGYAPANGWIMLYRLPLGTGGGSSYTHANGNWFSTGTVVTSGNGKRYEYNNLNITKIGFSVT